MLQVVIRSCLLLLLCGCQISGFFVSPSIKVQERTDRSLIWNGNRPYRSIVTEEETYKIAIGSDFHLGENENLTVFLEDNTDKATAVVLCGDICEGDEDSFANMKNTIEPFQNAMPIMPVIGNHELYFNGADLFFNYFHTSVYYFTVETPSRKDLHIVLDSGSGTLGEKQFSWLSDLLAKSRKNYDNCIVYTHTNIFNTDNSQLFTGNMPLEETFKLLALCRDNHINMVIAGHDHHRDLSKWGETTILTLDTAADGVKNSSYVLLSCENSSISYEYICF